MQRADSVGHVGALLQVGVQVGHLQRLALFLLGEDGLAYLRRILVDEAVGRVHDGLCGAVVLFQFKQPCRRIGVLEGEYVVDVRSPKRVPGQTDSQ